MENINQYYLDTIWNIYNLKREDGLVSLIYNDKEIFKGKLRKLIDISLPVKPIVYKELIIFFDYDRGIEIVRKDYIDFFNIRAVWNAFLIQNQLYLCKQKKIIIIDLDKLKVIKEESVSENADYIICNDYVLFNRIKYNKSCLINRNTSQVIDLGNKLLGGMAIKKIFYKKKYFILHYI